MKQKPIELDELTQRRNALAQALADDRRTPGGTLTDEQRRWFRLEQRHYSNGGDFETWAAAYDRIKAIEAKSAAAESEYRAAAAAKAADDAARAKEINDAIRAKIEAEVNPDPVTAWKRAHATRTF